MMLSAGEWNRDWKLKLRPFVKVFITLLIISGICFGLSAYDRFFNQYAVVITSEGFLRQGPLDESRERYPLRDGLEVTVLDSKGEWLQVIDSSQRIGWLKTNQVVILSR